MGHSNFEYETSVPFGGSPGGAMKTACSLLMANGFRLDQPTETEIIATGPGMQSTSENGIRGVSLANITVSADTIGVHAELGGVQTVRRFLYYGPPALGLLLYPTTLLIPNASWFVYLGVFAPLLPWLIISPLMVMWVKKRTTNAVDTMLHNMVNVRDTASEASTLDK